MHICFHYIKTYKVVKILNHVITAQKKGLLFPDFDNYTWCHVGSLSFHIFHFSVLSIISCVIVVLVKKCSIFTV